MAEERRDGRSEGAAPELADAAPPDALAEHREAPRALDVRQPTGARPLVNLPIMRRSTPATV